MPKALLLSQAEIIGLLDPDQLLEALAEGFKAITSDPEVVVPPRGELVVPGTGLLLTMPARAPQLHWCTKLVTDFPGNAQKGLPSHLALIVLLHRETGETLALMDGSHITAMRTAGAAVLAAQQLARPDAKVLTILGAGVQGRAHLELMVPRFDFEEIHVWSRDRAKAAELAALDPRARVADDREAAVRRADILCLCTHAHDPLVLAEWVPPGQHISSVGYSPPGGEIDPRIAERHTLCVEARVAFAPPPAGCAELAGADPDKASELGELLLGQRPGRRSPEEVTVYKAMGHAIEDLVTANLVYRNAIAGSVGRFIDI
ncbi:ornithine cyclodeaminase family protein [Novosphingobium resinovorum]|uniref:ornithine cyclodeaminase family protein n=1 Tax=Novosphingobium resinovorum TaxID=158500 RepID=UPI002ED183DC|nr:ornithine cyclodeaminase family protein [Novosphingobium resinovorum]